MQLRSGKKLLVASLAAASLAFAATAAAVVTIYENELNSASSMRELKQATGGNGCARNFSRQRKLMAVRVKGKRLCSYGPPVEGDADAPDVQIRVVATVLKGDSAQARKAAYLFAGVRTAGSKGYTLEIRPRSRRFVLDREPGGPGFPVSGRSEKIRGIGERNVFVLSAFGDVIGATANGGKLAQVTDANANGIDGRRVLLGLGSGRGLNPGPGARFTKVSVSVPDP